MRETISTLSRRDAIKSLTILAASAAISESSGLFTGPVAGPNQRQETKPETAQDISPLEDLMREHGVLERILLIYHEIIVRLKTGKEFPTAVLSEAGTIIRKFIENYHEKLEEDYLFPYFERANKFADLVKILRLQHQAGRQITDNIKNLAAQTSLQDPDARKKLTDLLYLFVRMYRPHKAREDTVLFPAVHHIIPPREYDALGDIFEGQEQTLFGKNGFEDVVGQVAELEKSLGIYELSQFTLTV